MTPIDRHPDHGFIWLYIAVILVFLVLTVAVAGSYDANHERRIKALEAHSALDVEVKDLHQKVRTLEAKCGVEK